MWDSYNILTLSHKSEKILQSIFGKNTKDRLTHYLKEKLMTTDISIAKSFVRAAFMTKDVETIRRLASKDFTFDCEWKDGTSLKWHNVEQMIGAYNFSAWTRSKVLAEISLKETSDNKLETVHLMKPQNRDDVVFRVHNIWTFTFDGEEDNRAISHILTVTDGKALEKDETRRILEKPMSQESSH